MKEALETLRLQIDHLDPEQVEAIKTISKVIETDINHLMDELVAAVDGENALAVDATVESIVACRKRIDNRETFVTGTFRDMMAHLSRKKLFDQMYTLVEDYREHATPLDHPDDYKGTVCLACDARIRKGKILCTQCGTVVALVKDNVDIPNSRTSKAIMSAMTTLSKVDWRVSVDLLFQYASEQDGEKCMEIITIILSYLRKEYGRGNRMVSAIGKASAWMIANDEWNGLANYAKDLRRVLSKDYMDKACGSIITSCQNPVCTVRYILENKDLYVCPDCGKVRSFCMVQGEPPDGRCAGHSLSLVMVNEKRYGVPYAFENSEMSIRLREFYENPEVLDSRAQIALVDLRIDQLTRQMSNVSVDMLKETLKDHGDTLSQIEKIASDAIDDGDVGKLTFMVENYKMILEDVVIMAGSVDDDKEIWREVRDNLETRRRQAEVALKREIANQHVITLSQFTEEMVKLTQAFVQHLALIDDPMLQHTIRGRIMGDVRQLMDANAIIEGEVSDG